MLTHNKRLYLILISIPLLLSIPLVAMLFSNEVDWTLSDFIIMGILLTCTGLSVELVLRYVKNPLNRLLAGAVVLLLFFVIYAELAVGIFGTPFAGS